MMNRAPKQEIHLTMRTRDFESAAFAWRRRFGSDPHTDERFEMFAEGYIVAIKERTKVQ